MAQRYQSSGSNYSSARPRHYSSGSGNGYVPQSTPLQSGSRFTTTGSSRYVQNAATPMKPASPYVSSRSPQGSRRPGNRRGNRRGLKAIVALVILIALGAGVYLFLNPPVFSVTINGTRQTVNAGTTIQDVIDKGWASPKAGNLMAVDGSVATEGGGQPFVATIDGNDTTDATTKLAKDQSVQISDGGNVDEAYTETTESIPHSTTDSSMNASSYYNGSIHIYSAGEDGEQTVRTGDVSGKTVTTVTKEPVSAGYHTYTANVGNDKVIALTFDDGPWPTTTAEILQILEDNGAHATFFEIGNQISENSDVVKQLAAAGNQICSHSWDHASGSGQGVNMTYMTADEQVEEVEKGFGAIDDLLGTKVSRVFRAPGGNYYGSLITTLQPYVTAEIGWDVDTEDWRKPGVDSIVSAAETIKPGQVLLMHDGGGDRTQSVEALKEILPALKAQGYSFITIDQLLAYGIPADA